jgi:hypothetical protein
LFLVSLSRQRISLKTFLIPTTSFRPLVHRKYSRSLATTMK